MESQAQSKSYLKALAKGQHEMKKQSFWPKNVILACGKSRPRKTWTHCKNLFNRGYIKDIIILLLFDEIIIIPIVQVIMAYQPEQLE